MKKITFIGNGNMALSIAQGLKKNYKIEVVGRDSVKLERFQKALGVDVEISLLDGFDISDKEVLLCVKPNNVEDVEKKLRGEAKVIYSVLAGTTISKLKNALKSGAVVRAMPNLAASVGESMTTHCGDEDFKDDAFEIFNSIGTTRWLGSEKEIDIATALAGSGPAYLALVAEAMTDAGVKMGLKRDDAEYLVLGLFEGFPKLLERFHNISQIKDETMSPKGTTAYGYATLEEYGVRNAFIKTVENAYNRALEISKKDKN